MDSLIQHLHNRHINFDIHRVWLDNEEYMATFPLLNLSGQLVGYQQYRPLANKEKKNNPKEGRYFTYTKKDTRGVWGLESWKFSKTLFITEGIFDACRLTDKGYSAIATMSNDPKHLLNLFYIISQDRPIVAICDNDSAGKKLAKYGTSSIIVEDGDLGDASEKYVNELLLQYK